MAASVGRQKQAHSLFLFLMINVNHTVDATNLPSITSIDNLHNNNIITHLKVISDLDSSVNQWEEDVISKGEGHMRQSRGLFKSLKLRLGWFHKSTKVRVGEEYSTDSTNNGTVIEELGLSIVNDANDGAHDVQPGWVGIIQKYFKHQIDLGAFDYKVAFHYREWWDDIRVITFELYDESYTSIGDAKWRKENGSFYLSLTPRVSGEIIRAFFKPHDNFYGNRFYMVPIHLLGTTIDCDLGSSEEIEFFPAEKILSCGIPFEVSHIMRATKTGVGSFELTIPLSIKFTFTVRAKA